MNNLIYGWREGLSLCLAVLAAMVVNHYLIHTEAVWVLLSAAVLLVATRGHPFRQGIIFTTCLLIAVSFAGLISLHHAVGMYIVVPMVFFIAGTFIAPITYLFMLMFIVSLLMPASSNVLLMDRIVNVMLGSLIGYLIGQFILPVNMIVKLRKGLTPCLSGMFEYCQAVTSRIKHYYDPDKRIDIATNIVELMLSSGGGGYPEWVYEEGFNPGLRTGFRYFLIRIERLMELLMSLNCIADRIHYHHIPDAVMDLMVRCMQTNGILLNMVGQYVAEGIFIEDNETDFLADVSLLEEEITSILPGSIELIDVTEQYIEVAALLYTIKDLRKTLLQVVLVIGN